MWSGGGGGGMGRQRELIIEPHGVFTPTSFLDRLLKFIWVDENKAIHAQAALINRATQCEDIQ